MKQAHQIATRLAPSESPEAVARRMARLEMAAELTPRAQSGSPIDKDALLAEIDAIIAAIPGMTQTQLKGVLVKLCKAVKYGLRRL